MPLHHFRIVAAVLEWRRLSPVIQSYHRFAVLAVMSGFNNFIIRLNLIRMKKLLTTLPALGCFFLLLAQQDPEFPKEKWVLYLEAHQGMATNFHRNPDVYVGGVRLTPQFPVIAGKLRLGAVAGAVFTNKKWHGTFGPNLAWKLKSLQVKEFGSLLNLQLQAEHLWGTNRQRLAGGGVKTEIGQLLTIAIMGHRDYHLNYWWWQVGIGFNLLRKKKGPPADPLDNP
jgi:hypothetical protein